MHFFNLMAYFFMAFMSNNEVGAAPLFASKETEVSMENLNKRDWLEIMKERFMQRLEKLKGDFKAISKGGKKFGKKALDALGDLSVTTKNLTEDLGEKAESQFGKLKTPVGGFEAAKVNESARDKAMELMQRIDITWAPCDDKTLDWYIRKYTHKEVDTYYLKSEAKPVPTGQNTCSCLFEKRYVTEWTVKGDFSFRKCYAGTNPDERTCEYVPTIIRATTPAGLIANPAGLIAKQIGIMKDWAGRTEICIGEEAKPQSKIKVATLEICKQACLGMEECRFVAFKDIDAATLAPAECSTFKQCFGQTTVTPTGEYLLFYKEVGEITACVQLETEKTCKECLSLTHSVEQTTGQCKLRLFQAAKITGIPACIAVDGAKCKTCQPNFALYQNSCSPSNTAFFTLGNKLSAQSEFHCNTLEAFWSTRKRANCCIGQGTLAIPALQQTIQDLGKTAIGFAGKIPEVVTKTFLELRQGAATKNCNGFKPISCRGTEKSMQPQQVKYCFHMYEVFQKTVGICGTSEIKKIPSTHCFCQPKDTTKIYQYNVSRFAVEKDKTNIVNDAPDAFYDDLNIAGEVCITEKDECKDGACVVKKTESEILTI